MIGQNMISRLYDSQVIDPRGEKIGAVKQVWLDGSTGDPVWASVHTGLFGLKETFVPLQRAEIRDDQVQVPVAKEQVKEAPRIDTNGDRMSEADQAALCAYYGVPGMGAGTGDPSGRRGQGAAGNGQQGNGRQGNGRPGDMPAGGSGRPGDAGRGRADATDRATSGQLSGDLAGQGEDISMTRSEERLKVGTERVETGRVRLVKHVVTENQQVTVPVSHEEVHLEREPIADGRPGQKLADGEQEIALHAERPIVDKETVAVENVRLAKERVTEQQTVSDEVRKERIDVENDSNKRR